MAVVAAGTSATLTCSIVVCDPCRRSARCSALISLPPSSVFSAGSLAQTRTTDIPISSLSCASGSSPLLLSSLLPWCMFPLRCCGCKCLTCCSYLILNRITWLDNLGKARVRRSFSYVCERFMGIPSADISARSTRTL